MNENYFFSQVEINALNESLLHALRDFANRNSLQTYAIKEPLGEEKYNYDYENVIIALIPGYKIMIINLEEHSNESFNYFVDDFVEDLSHLSDKFSYKTKIGRPRDWKKNQIAFLEGLSADEFIKGLEGYRLTDPAQRRISELLISLLIGSINSINDIEIAEPASLLDKVKQKIVLFDSDQTRFIFEQINKKRIVIQGLAGTGKTELLLHKLKELYVREGKSKIAFTCHSKTLSSNLKKRVPEFFTFMKVQEQIQWNERLWVHGSWGSQNIPNSGLYSFLCSEYGIPFQRWSRVRTFAKVCGDAVSYLKEKEFEPYFDYILIDESQDFSEEFFELCEMVTKKTVYVAGDIFQNIFDNSPSTVNPDFLLNKCYRTDPRTLMFSHAVGLGLFERPVVNWLEDREWEACGYQISVEGKDYTLTREKIRRFEDLENMTNVNPVEIYIEEKEHLLYKVIDVIDDIKTKHPTAKPDDIGIVFVDNSKSIYGMIDELDVLIANKFEWDINRGYENKGLTEETIFVSNRNNIKGLEFPFLICVVTNEVEKNIPSRNTLYMTLTRSFISSYLIMSDTNEDLYSLWRSHLHEIISANKLFLVEPDPDEIMSPDQLEITEASYRTYYEIVEDLFVEFKIPSGKRDKMFKILEAYSTTDADPLTESILRKIIKKNLEILNEQDI